MNAYEIPNLRYSLPAGSAVERARFVSVNTTGQGIQANATSNIVGVSMNRITSAENTAGGHIVEIADGIVMVEAAGTIASGALVYSDANGKAAASGTVVAGVAITAGAAGQLMAVKL